MVQRVPQWVQPRLRHFKTRRKAQFPVMLLQDVAISHHGHLGGQEYRGDGVEKEKR